MSSHKKTTKKFASGQGGGSRLIGLRDFRKNLERDFFAESQISWKLDKDGITTNLIVNLNCNFSLTESLFHLNNGNWGGFLVESQEAPKFEQSIQELVNKNNRPIEIVEFCLNLRDTSLIISKIYPRSITDYLGAILPAISSNFVHFTKGLTEMPFEIFVPVFIEHTQKQAIDSIDTNNVKGSTRGYFDYWGLYFESNAEKDAVIYDVKNKNIIEGDFFLLDY